MANRPIFAVKVANQVQRPQDRRPEVLYFAGVHSREVATTEVLLQYIEHLLNHAETDPRVRFILDNRQTWIVPVLNPDGREYVFRRDIWWRKNRRRTREHGPVGIDLNRNFAYQWGRIEGVQGSSSDPHSGTFRGEEPFSEPETRALRNFVLNHRFRASLSYHSYGEYLIIPYGFTDDPVPDASTYDRLAREVARSIGYRHGNVLSMVGYYSNGRHDDWLYSNLEGKTRIYAMEIELGRTFFPYEEDLPALGQKALGANLTMGMLSGGYPQIELVSAPDPQQQPVSLRFRVRNRGLLPIQKMAIRLLSANREPIHPDPLKIPVLGGLSSAALATTAELSVDLPDDRPLLNNLLFQLDYEDGQATSHTVGLEVLTD